MPLVLALELLLELLLLLLLELLLLELHVQLCRALRRRLSSSAIRSVSVFCGAGMKASVSVCSVWTNHARIVLLCVCVSLSLSDVAFVLPFPFHRFPCESPPPSAKSLAV